MIKRRVRKREKQSGRKKKLFREEMFSLPEIL